MLVQLCKHKSENCREQIARYVKTFIFVLILSPLNFSVFLGLCENEKHRGVIVAGGGAKVRRSPLLVK